MSFTKDQSNAKFSFCKELPKFPTFGNSSLGEGQFDWRKGQIVAVPYQEDVLLHAADRQIEMR